MTNPVSAQVVPMKLSITRFHEDPFPPLARGGGRPVYPYAMQDDVTDELEEREFRAVVLDNGLLRLTVLPELGGHVLSLRDLVHGREVFFHNVPLKLGLVAMRGAWWAGGIEWNFPHVGHAVTTVSPVAWHVRQESDGSATVFVGAVEHLTRMAWQVALTLRPDDWRLGVRIRLHNRTPFSHRIYFWSNSAVAARDDFRLLLPATRVFSWWYGADGDAPFPIKDGHDLSRYASFRGGDIFAKDLRADWFGGYYEELDCGLVHQASRFEVPGRKMFSWGHGGHGRMWAELLNARGEPYIELQSGRFVHQGLHRILAPGAVESWEESWAPVWGLGGVVHAAGPLVLNAVSEGDGLDLRLLALARVEEAAICVRQGERELASIHRSLAPGELASLHVPLEGDGALAVSLGGDTVTLRVEGGVVRPALDGVPPHLGMPDASPDEAPATLQGWLLKARTHEQRNDLGPAADCYRKALELDPACTAAMAGLAQRHLKRGETRDAKDWAAKALAADPQHEDALWWLSVAMVQDGGEPLAQLSALRRSPRYAAAATAMLGEMALRRSEPVAALELFAGASERHPHDARIVALAACAARLGGAPDSARALLAECEKHAPLEPLLWAERHFQGVADDAALEAIFAQDPQAYLEAACDYERLGAWEDAARWLRDVACRHTPPSRQAMLLYHLAACCWRLGRVDEALAAARQAAAQSPAFANPHRTEDGAALRTALQLRPDDPIAHLLLGNCLTALGCWDEAARHWTRTTVLVPSGEAAIIAWRNLAAFHWHKQRNAPEALAAYAHALDSLSSLPSSPPTPNTEPRTPLPSSAWRLWLARDHVLAAAGRHAERLAAFESAPDAVKARWQVLARWADASLRAGQPERAIELLSACRFKPWEGEARPRLLWKEAHLALGHRAKEAGDMATARAHFESAADYPHHLAVGRPIHTDDADALYWAGWCALETGGLAEARRLLTAAATEPQPRDAATADYKLRAAELLRYLP